MNFRKNTRGKTHRLFHLITLLWAAAALAIVSGCDRAEEVPQISLQDVEQAAPAKPTPASNPLRIAISAVISPKETLIYYKGLLRYLSEKSGLPVKLVQRGTYDEVNELIKKEELELAFVCSGAYVKGHDDFGMELLVAPVAYGKTIYHSYIIVPGDSDIQDVDGLQGRRFAFTDPMSNTGRLAPTYMLARSGRNPEDFFDSYIFTYSHDRSIEAVAQKLVDGAAVDSLVWEYLDKKKPALTAMTRIISKSPPFGIPPVVVPKGLDPDTKDELRSILTHMHEDDIGKKILAQIMIDRFVEINDRAYDSIREMETWLKGYEENQLAE